jgi:hypothetical protein
MDGKREKEVMATYWNEETIRTFKSGTLVLL